VKHVVVYVKGSETAQQLMPKLKNIPFRGYVIMIYEHRAIVYYK